MYAHPIDSNIIISIVARIHLKRVRPTTSFLRTKSIGTKFIRESDLKICLYMIIRNDRERNAAVY